MSFSRPSPSTSCSCKKGSQAARDVYLGTSRQQKASALVFDKGDPPFELASKRPHRLTLVLASLRERNCLQQLADHVSACIC